MKSEGSLAMLLACAVILAGTAKAELPSGWEHVDVGIPPAGPGAASCDEQENVYTVVGGGKTELYLPPTDALHFVFKFGSGDCEIIARVSAIEDANEWAKAGIMMRESLDPDAPCALMALTPNGRVLFQHRKARGQGLWSQHSPVPSDVDLPCWIRLVRERNTFTGYYSTDGENWIRQPNHWIAPPADNPARIDMSYDVLIGLFVTSQDRGRLCTATFDQVKVTVPAGTAITYQGYLVNQGLPVNGLHDLQFRLYDMPVGGHQVGDTCDANEVGVVEGCLATVVFFGGTPDVFNGEARWLQIAVKPSGQPDEAYTVLEPRQRITPTPYAVHADKPAGPQGPQGPPGPKGDRPAHQWIDENRAWIKFENPDGSWDKQWHYLGGERGPAGPVPKHRWDETTGCLQFEQPDGTWGSCINISPITSLQDADWVIDGQNIYHLSGRVGILTSSPARALDVAGEARFDGALFARDTTGIGFKDAAGALGVWVEDGGQVGVGTTTPQKALDVNGQGRFDGSIFARDATGIGLVDPSGDLGVWVRDGGNVGVRTSSPAEELDVNGQGRFDGEIFARSTYGIGLVDRLGRNGVWVEEAGDVGIGTRTPEVTLDVRGGERIAGNMDGIVTIRCLATATRLALDGDEIQARYRDGLSPLFLNRLGGNVLLVTSGGKVGIGTDKCSVDVAIGDPDTGLDSARTGELDLWSNGVNVASVRSNGVGVRVANPTEAVDVDGTVRLRRLGQGSGTPVVADGAGKLWKESSSRRYKDGIRDLETAGDAVLMLRPVRFRWKATGQEEIGLIAEEVAAVARDLVVYDAEGRPESVKYDKLSLYLLSVIRAQQDQINTLERRVRDFDTLERRITSLEQSTRRELTNEL